MASALDTAKRSGSSERASGVAERVESVAGLSAAELAELMSSFNELSHRLQEGHERLRAEVSRLTSELDEAREQLARSRRLAALGEMAAGIAHEVRNPLGSIGLYAEMLREDLSERPRERELASKITRAVRGLDAVVHDVLCFAREAPVRAEVVEATELFDAALAASVGPDDGSVRVVRADREHASRVRCDPRLAQRALVNVIRNALESMQEHSSTGGHRLTLDARRDWAVDADGRRREVLALVIQDTGPGIPSEVLDRMFNPFFTTRETGTGLGLAIVHRIVDAHGGRVVVRNGHDEADASPTGTGATIELHFPMDSAPCTGAVATRLAEASMEAA